MTYYCPSCWNEVGTALVCPHCGADLHDLGSESYEAKLIRALHHSEPTVPVRAAMFLGDLRSKASVEPLIEVAASSRDPYIQEAAVDALGHIGDPRALHCLEQLSREGVVRVRRAAQQAIKTLRNQANASQE